MKRIVATICLALCICLWFVPLPVQSAEETERWTMGPWQTEQMISWGDDLLIVDFGKNGLWRYDGSWRRLSYWDPQEMLTWGESKLVVDFGNHGLWKFDKSRWEKIAL